MVDILVCDGFTGTLYSNIPKIGFQLILNAEGCNDENTINKLAALILKPSLRQISKKMDYTEIGGAPLLGINGGIIKAHGSSNAIAIKNAIRQGILYTENEVLKRISDAVTSTGED